MKIKKYLLVPIVGLLFVLALCPSKAAAQEKFAIKTNGIYLAALMPNVGFEFAPVNKFSIELDLAAFPWKRSDWCSSKIFMIQPWVKYWLKDSMAGSFVGLGFCGGSYDMGGMILDFKFLGTDFSLLNTHQFKGSMGGISLSYGYAWILNKNLNLEAEIGIGYIYSTYDEYDLLNDCELISKQKGHNYVGPTKVSVAISYVF